METVYLVIFRSDNVLINDSVEVDEESSILTTIRRK